MTSTQSNVINVPSFGANRLTFLDQLESDISFNDYWQELVKAAEEEFEANKNKKNRFDIIAHSNKSGTYFANPAHLHVKAGFNFRNFNSPKGIESIKRMAAEIVGESAITEPLKIFHEGNNPTFYIENGHRRFTGLKYAIVHLDYRPANLRIPVRMGAKGNDVDRKFSQIRDNSGEKPSPLEMARIFADMMKLGGREEELAKRAGISKSRVISLLDMASIPAALQSYSESTDIEIADSFIHNLYRAVNRDSDRALNDLETAIRRAKEQDYDRVMPKHLPPETYALYKGESPAKSSKAATKPVLAPVPSTPDVEDEAPRSAQTSVDETMEDIEGDEVAPEVHGNDYDHGADTTRVASDPAPATAKDNDDKSSDKPAKSTKSPELPVRPSSMHNQRPDNLKFRVALMHFFKHVVQFSPIDPDNPHADRTVTFVGGAKEFVVDNETAMAILHSLNLD